MGDVRDKGWVNSFNREAELRDPHEMLERYGPWFHPTSRKMRPRADELEVYYAMLRRARDAAKK